MTRVQLILPVSTDPAHATETAAVERADLPGIRVDVVSLDDSVPETAFLPSPALSTNQLLRRVLEAEAGGYDAAVIACAADPSVAVAKTLVKMPVVGPMEAAVHLASSLGGHLGVVTAKLVGGADEHQPDTVNWLRDLVQGFGMSHRIAGIRSVHPDHPAGDEAERMRREDPAGLSAAISTGMREAAEGPGLACARELVRDCDATSILFACTQWGGLLDGVRAQLPVPVLDPVVDTVRYAALLARAGRP